MLRRVSGKRMLSSGGGAVVRMHDECDVSSVWSGSGYEPSVEIFHDSEVQAEMGMDEQR